MTKRERQAVEQTIRGVFAEWHCCGLNAKDAKAMGLKAGRLCDACLSGVKMHYGLFLRRADANC